MYTPSADRDGQLLAVGDKVRLVYRGRPLAATLVYFARPVPWLIAHGFCPDDYALSVEEMRQWYPVVRLDASSVIEESSREVDVSTMQFLWRGRLLQKIGE